MNTLINDECCKIDLKKRGHLGIFFLLIYLFFMGACTADMLPTVTDEVDFQECDITIGWTAFKFPIFEERLGVSGVFEDFEYNIINRSDNIIEKLDGASLTIHTNSVNIGGSSEKTNNVANHFFANFTPLIECKVNAIDDQGAHITVTMNTISKEILLKVTFDEEQRILTLSGTLENLNEFKAETALSKLDEVCGAYHQGFVWPDVDLKITLNNYNNFQ